MCGRYETIGTMNRSTPELYRYNIEAKVGLIERRYYMRDYEMDKLQQERFWQWISEWPGDG